MSRGELIEIGGAYRLPSIIAAGGASLVEVGTTNRTRLSDYRSAISDNTAALLKVHTSNYQVVGFTEAAGLGNSSSWDWRPELRRSLIKARACWTKGRVG